MKIKPSGPVFAAFFVFFTGVALGALCTAPYTWYPAGAMLGMFICGIGMEASKDE